MIIKIKWNEDEVTKDVEATESAVWKCIGEILLCIKIPNTIFIHTIYGDAALSVRKRGSYIKDGIRRPSMFVMVEKNYISLAPDDYPEAYLTCINAESNNYKFYHLKPSVSGIHVTYGRIGSDRGEAFGVKDIQQPYPSYLYWIRYYEKLSKGYIDQSDIYLKSESDETVTDNESTEGKGLRQSDEKQRKVNPFSAALYKRLQSCARQYIATQCIDVNVTKKQFVMSKQLLQELGETDSVDAFNQKLMKLLTICPRKSRYVSELLARSKRDFSSIINREENLVAAMEALLAPEPQNFDDSFEAMGIEVYEATEKQKQEVLRHLSDTLKPKVKTIYRVINRKKKQNFDQYLEKENIQKVKQFWHGSRNENWFSIIVNGLQLNPNARITGKMFGDGIYFAPKADKSWNYTSYHGTHYAHGTSDTAYMGLCATAYGKPLNVECAGRYNQSQLKANGKNCVHAHAGKQLLNDEIIYYSEDAICLNYIVEFA